MIDVVGVHQSEQFVVESLEVRVTFLVRCSVHLMCADDGWVSLECERMVESSEMAPIDSMLNIWRRWSVSCRSHRSAESAVDVAVAIAIAWWVRRERESGSREIVGAAGYCRSVPFRTQTSDTFLARRHFCTTTHCPTLTKCSHNHKSKLPWPSWIPPKWRKKKIVMSKWKGWT